MKILLCCLILLIIIVAVWFMIPYSPLKVEFEKKCSQLFKRMDLVEKIFSKEVLGTKPELLQKYIKYCGLYNKPMMSYSITVHKDADFLLKDGSPMIKIKYTQVNFGGICERLAFIDTKMGMLPFQGLDHNVDGKGSMKGVIAKLFTVFNVGGREMDIASLVTVLAEGIVCPAFLMDDDISWKEIDGTHLEATLIQYGYEVSGIFEFDGEGAIINFYTKDRYMEEKGVMIRRDWKATCGNYEEIEGIKRPTKFKGSWIYEDRELIYFDCSDVHVKFY